MDYKTQYCKDVYSLKKILKNLKEMSIPPTLIAPMESQSKL